MDTETATAALKDRIRAICSELLAEPLFHMSLGSKELFHSNFVAWFAGAYYKQTDAVFGPWGDHDAGARIRAVDREKSHLDLVLYLPGFRPIAIENKVFSVPDPGQLRKYANNAVKKMVARDGPVTKILLTLMDPGEVEVEGWRVVRYGDLATALELQHASIDKPFDGEIVRRYAHMVRHLVELLQMLGSPGPNEPYLVKGLLELIGDPRLSAAIQKARASYVLRELRRRRDQFGEREGVDVRGFGVDDGFTNGTTLLQGFVRLGDNPDDLTKDALGWQFQGTQFRLAVVTSATNAGDREHREKYVSETYREWFDFDLLEGIVGDEAKARPKEMRGTWQYQGYSPDFVYRYRSASSLTSEQLIALALAYMQRAQLLLDKTATTAPPPPQP